VGLAQEHVAVRVGKCVGHDRLRSAYFK
jgi:hypothetical protein